MPISRHPLNEEFPDYFSKLQTMKQSEPSFAALVNEYDTTDKKIHGLESILSPVSDAHISELKRRRLNLKDAIQDQLVR